MTEDKKTNESDTQLVLRAQGGDQAAFEELTLRYFDTAFLVAYSLLRHREASEDLAQETLLRAWLKLGALRRPEQFASWLTVMARRLALNWLRQGQRASKVLPMISQPLHDDAPAFDPPAPDVPITENLATEQDQSVLNEALAQLPEKQREVVLLHYMHDLSHREIARRLGCHHTSVGRLITKALRVLRKTVDDPEVLKEHRTSVMLERRSRDKAVACVAMGIGLSGTSKTALAAVAEATAPPKWWLIDSAAKHSWLLKLIQLTEFTQLQGAVLMTTTNKVIAVVACAALLYGGSQAYQAMQPAPTVKEQKIEDFPAIDRTFPYQFGSESNTVIESNETIRMTFDAQSIWNEESIDIHVQPDGMMRVRLNYGDHQDYFEFYPMNPELNTESVPMPTNIQIWAEMNRVAIQSIHIDLPPNRDGLQLHMYSTNRPELLADLKAKERDFKEGRISVDEQRSYAVQRFTEAGMLPEHPGHRAQILEHIKSLF